MRFDNAFLTKDGEVGIQFVHEEGIITVWRDHKTKKILFSEGVSILNKSVIREKYLKLETIYTPKSR